MVALEHDPQKHVLAKAGMDAGFATKITLKQRARARFRFNRDGKGSGAGSEKSGTPVFL
jgi:hypothetical protein